MAGGKTRTKTKTSTGAKSNPGAKPQRPDFLLAASALIILAFGLVMVLSAGAKFSYASSNNPYRFFILQLIWAAAGTVLAFVALYVPFAKWRRICGLALFAGIVFLLLVEFTSLGDRTAGAARWLILSGSIHFQPSELAKPIIILFLAHNFDQYPVSRLRDALWPGLLVMAVILLVLRQDLGTAFVMLVAVVAMLLQTGFPLRYLVVGIPAAFLLGANHVLSTDYQKERIVAWLDPWNNLGAGGAQMARSEVALALGGAFGVGIGNNTIHLALPENYNDMIFSVIGQELGFFGAFVFLIVLTFFIVRCYYVVSRCPDHFGRLLGFGFASLIAIQCVVNICSALGILPVTGITLPLVSYGGTSLVVTMFEIGVLLNISRYGQQSS